MSLSERGRRIWNCDETGVCTSVASRKILARRGDKDVHETGGGSGREFITILAGGSAIGEKLPPYIIYKGKNLMSSHTRGGPPKTRYSMSSSGWMEEANFLEWFKKVFIPEVDDIRQSGPVILFLDGHQSYSSLALVEEAQQKGIILYVFPPHTTHLLQPLDVGVYGPLKKVWSKVLKDYKLSTMAAKVDRLVFPSLVSKMWDQVLLPEQLIGGFRATGLHPFSRDAIAPVKLARSVPFNGGSPLPTSKPQTCNEITPVTRRVVSLLGELFTSNATNVPARTRAMTEPRHYGEALTEEEIASRIREKAEEKERKKQEKAAKKGKRGRKKKDSNEDENVCQGCHGTYDDDDEETQEAWIGCDERGCWRWYHYWCGGENDMPDPKLKWVCPACKDD